MRRNPESRILNPGRDVPLRELPRGEERKGIPPPGILNSEFGIRTP
jgi:hypothetical protein